MNDQDMAQNDIGDETDTLDTPSEEEQTVGDTEQVEEASETEAVETAEVKKKGYEARVRELNAKAKEAEARAESLAQRLSELTRAESPQQDFTPAYNPNEPLIAPGEEIDVLELNKRQTEREARLLKATEAKIELARRQSDAISRINSESREVESKYPELNPDSDSFNPKLSKTVTKAAEAYIKANPYSASVKEFVDELMDSYTGAVAAADGKASEKIAKQVSQAALRPSSVRQPEKPASEKTIEELEKELGIVQA